MYIYGISNTKWWNNLSLSRNSLLFLHFCMSVFSRSFIFAHPGLCIWGETVFLWASNEKTGTKYILLYIVLKYFYRIGVVSSQRHYHACIGTLFEGKFILFSFDNVPLLSGHDDKCAYMIVVLVKFTIKLDRNWWQYYEGMRWTDAFGS